MPTGRKELKMFLFAVDMILYIRGPKVSTFRTDDHLQQEGNIQN